MIRTKLKPVDEKNVKIEDVANEIAEEMEKNPVLLTEQETKVLKYVIKKEAERIFNNPFLSKKQAREKFKERFG